MKRPTSISRSDCRHSQQAGLLLAAIALFASQAVLAQSLPAADSSASGAVPTVTEASATATLTPAAAVTPSKIAAPSTLLPAPTWAGLSAAQKSALLPLQQDWDGLDADRRSQWLEVATRSSKLPAEDQARMQERMREWARLSPAERQQARIGFQGAKKITADARQAKWEAYQALPQEQRQQLADKAAKKLQAQSDKAPLNALNGASNGAPQAKSNLVPAVPLHQVSKAVASTLVQAKPGATTVLITQDQRIPAHQQAGNTKVLADPDLVDSKTLLPKRLRTSTSAPLSP
jgi:hypothetical protein